MPTLLNFTLERSQRDASRSLRNPSAQEPFRTYDYRYSSRAVSSCIDTDTALDLYLISDTAQSCICKNLAQCWVYASLDCNRVIHFVLMRTELISVRLTLVTTEIVSCISHSVIQLGAVSIGSSIQLRAVSDRYSSELYLELYQKIV